MLAVALNPVTTCFAGHHPLVPRLVMEDALRFAKYATAVYGSTFYTWMLKKK